jgi:hypothetical protein
MAKSNVPKMAGVPEKVRVRTTPRSSAPVAIGAVTYGAAPGPVRRLPPNRKARVKGLP